ncbi:MAG: ELM1/GtrOC1 family putative glycosyltransferase [Gammaproteobacteria bacterium]
MAAKPDRLSRDGAERAHETPARQPLIWVVSGYRAGENTQVSALADRLGLPWLRKDLDFNALAGPVGLLRMSNQAGVEIDSSSILAPPWPDLVISAGLKNEPVCRWIKHASGGRTKLVFLGRVWAPREEFDLIITTPQYRLPKLPNVLHNLCTQHPITPEKMAIERERWNAQFGPMPAPRIGVLVGGDSGPYALGRQAGLRLAAELMALHDKVGGSILVTSSARTRPVVMDMLEHSLPEAQFVYRWRPRGRTNPFLGILAHADLLVVTCDSIAMISEAAATGKPVYMFRMRTHGPEDATLSTRLYRALLRWGPQKLSRDQSLCHQGFIDAGYAGWLGHAQAERRGSPESEIGRTLDRLRALLGIPESPADAQVDSQPDPTAIPFPTRSPSPADRPDPQSLPAQIDAIRPES